MAKKQDGEASAEAASRRRPQKKTAAPKPAGRNRAAKPARPVKSARAPERAARPARPARGRRTTEPQAQAELPIGELEPETVDDADIVSESSETTSEVAPVAPPPALALVDSDTEEVIEVDDQPPTLS